VIIEPDVYTTVKLISHYQFIILKYL
jgi:hypothetical protein